MLPLLIVHEIKAFSIIYCDGSQHSRVLAKNLTSVLTFSAQEVVDVQSENKKHNYQINFTQALSKSKDTVFLLFDRTCEAVLEIIKGLLEIFVMTAEPIRPERKFERNHNINKRE